MKKHTNITNEITGAYEPIGLLSWSLIVLGGVIITFIIADLIFADFSEVATEVLSEVVMLFR